MVELDGWTEEVGGREEGRGRVRTQLCCRLRGGMLSLRAVRERVFGSFLLSAY